MPSRRRWRRHCACYVGTGYRPGPTPRSLVPAVSALSGRRRRARGRGWRTLQRVAGELRAVLPKTRTSRRTVPLIGLCVDALKEHQARQAEEAKRAGKDWQDSGYVFTTTTRDQPSSRTTSGGAGTRSVRRWTSAPCRFTICQPVALTCHWTPRPPPGEAGSHSTSPTAPGGFVTLPATPSAPQPGFDPVPPP